MLNFNSIMIGTSQPKLLGEFYQKVFGRDPDMHEENSYYGWQVGESFFNVGEHSEITGPSKEPQRLIVNLETADIKTEFERIKATGATVVKELYEMEGMPGMQIATFADPDGNYFQLMTPWEAPAN
jgi:predicted enzyme related to lactoylglutathione lyase